MRRGLNVKKLAEAFVKAKSAIRRQARVKRTLRLAPKWRKALHAGAGTDANQKLFGVTWKEASQTQRDNRRAAGYYGRGGYWGRMLGGLVGHADLGDKIGDFMGAGIRAVGGGSLMDAANAASRALAGRGLYTGRGDYALANGTVDGGARDPIPGFVAAGDNGGVVVTHKEYLCDVYGPPAGVPFQNTAYQINPGVERSFPWLSQIAANYEEYEIKQLLYTYRSTTTDFSGGASGQCGTLIMATQYNPAQEPFTDKHTMMEYDMAMSGKTTKDQLHGVECDPAKLSGPEGKYVRTGPVPAGQDLKTYDHAQFNIAVANIPTAYENQALGELWVAYTVVLRKPRFYTAKGLSITRDVHVWGPHPGAPPVTVGGALGSAGRHLEGQQNSLGAVVELDPSAGPSLEITFPSSFAGNVEVTLLAASPFGSAGTFTDPAIGLQGNIQLVNDFPSDVGQWTNCLVSLGPSSVSKKIHLRVSAPSSGVDNVLGLDVSGMLGTIVGSVQLEIKEYNAGFDYKQDGKNDAIILVNSSTGEVEQW